MGERKFIRRVKEDKPVLAICYDFDKTLSPDDMQAQGFIQKVGYDVEEFWKESNARAEKNEMDTNLAYMYQMIDASEGKQVFTKQKLMEYGSKVKFFPGVEEWFNRIRQYGEENGVIVEHYIISSGLKEMIEGTSIAKEFDAIYASSFFYNEKGVAKWPAQAVNYTNKTQFLFRIEKGILDVNDNGVNDYFTPDKIRVPFRNMVYIGDSDTDVPCMKLVNSYGGHSIGVYDPSTKDQIKVFKMINENRIRYYAAADYSENSELDKLLKIIILKTRADEALETKHYKCINESTDYYMNESLEEQEKQYFIFQLESSNSFRMTHSIIHELSTYKTWTDEQRVELAQIAVDNSQVFLILGNKDVKGFYKHLLEKFQSEDIAVNEVKSIIMLQK